MEQTDSGSLIVAVMACGGCRVCGGRAGTGGGGDGLQLVMRINGWNFKQTLDSVGKWLNAPETDFGGMPRYKVPRAEKKEKEQEEWIPLDEQPEEELAQLQKEKGIYLES